MRDAAEKLQHRRHRPVYLAPTAVNFQHYSTKSYDSGEYFGDDSYDNDNFIEDLRIPLFVEIPHDEKLRFPITSPPCSNGSEVSTSLSALAPQIQHQSNQSLSVKRRKRHTRSFRIPFGEKFCKVISSVFVVVTDFLLLIFVCLMGLFFHVEVQIVKQRGRGRRGRVIVQQTYPEETQQHQFQSTDLLAPLQQHSYSSPWTEDIV